MPQVFRVLAGGAALVALVTTAVLASPSAPDSAAPRATRAADATEVFVSSTAAAAAAAAAAAGGSRDAGPDASTATDLPTASASGSAATGSAVAVDYDWPLATPAVVRAFDDPAEPWLAGHRGVDLAGSVVAPVRAAADGVVAFAGSVAGRGVVSVDHADGIRTTYEPVTAVVVAGQIVVRGDVIGTLDAGHPGLGGALPVDGSATLHWGARTGPQTYVDPTLLVAGDVVVRLWE